MRHTLSIPNKRMQGTGEAFPASVPASIKGWDAISSLADMPPDHAVVLDNFIPRPGFLEMRRGSIVYATALGTAASPVETVMGYNAQIPSDSKLFAISGGTIYDISAGTAGSPTTVTGLSTSRAQYVNFTNASGVTHLFVATGGDTPVTYSTSWATAGVTGITSADIIQPAVWKGRLWFVLANSTQVAYMPVGDVAGTAATFDLGSLMSKGGYITAIGTWTVDMKQAVDEFIAFISSRGQIFIYQGTDPSTSNTFALVAVYDLGAPIGQRCFLRISGNLWLITLDGIIPMTEMLVSAIDRLAAPRVSVSANIMNAINSAVQQYGTNWGWQLVSYPRGTLAILNVPVQEDGASYQYVMNTITGAWCRFTGMTAVSWEVFNDNPYFGSNDGKVYRWDYGSGDEVGDEDFPITAQVQTAFNYFDTRGFKKRFTAIRPILNTDNAVVPGVGLNIDFSQNAVISVPSTVSTTSSLWDVAIWDVNLWPQSSGLVANWTTVDGIGMCASIVTQLQTSDNGSENGVFLQLNGWDLTMEKGTGFY